VEGEQLTFAGQLRMTEGRSPGALYVTVRLSELEREHPVSLRHLVRLVPVRNGAAGRRAANRAALRALLGLDAPPFGAPPRNAVRVLVEEDESSTSVPDPKRQVAAGAPRLPR